MAKYEIAFVRNATDRLASVELVWAVSGADAIGKLHQRHPGERIHFMEVAEVDEPEKLVIR